MADVVESSMFTPYRLFLICAGVFIISVLGFAMMNEVTPFVLTNESSFELGKISKTIRDESSTVTGTALPSKKGYAYVYSTHTFLNYCPLCGAKDCLLWNPKRTFEGEWTCKRCSADYCAVTGKDKNYYVRATLTEVEIIDFGVLYLKREGIKL